MTQIVLQVLLAMTQSFADSVLSVPRNESNPNTSMAEEKGIELSLATVVERVVSETLEQQQQLPYVITDAPKPVFPLLDFPPDIILEIAEQLDFQSFLALRYTSPQLRRILNPSFARSPKLHLIALSELEELVDRYAASLRDLSKTGDEYFACFHCLKLLPKHRFHHTMIDDKWSKQEPVETSLGHLRHCRPCMPILTFCELVEKNLNMFNIQYRREEGFIPYIKYLLHSIKLYGIDVTTVLLGRW